MLRAEVYAGYTPQDNQADFGPMSPLPTILGNVPIILVVLKISYEIFLWCEVLLRVTESAWKNVRGAPIANHVEYLRSKTLMCGGTFRSHRGTPHTIGAKRLNLGFFCPLTL